MSDQPQRRASDIDEQHEIERLIQQENDPKARLHLMILNRISISLIANTQTINDVATKLDEHLTSYEEQSKNTAAAVNQGKGAWKVVSWVLGLVQVVGLGIWASVGADIKHIHESINASVVSDARLDARLSAIEKRLDR